MHALVTRLRPLAGSKWQISASVLVASMDCCMAPRAAFLQYEFTINWPASWTAYGYTAFTMGFSDAGKAIEWYEAISAIIRQLAEAKRNKSGLPADTKDTSALATNSVPALGKVRCGARRAVLRPAMMMTACS